MLNVSDLVRSAPSRESVDMPRRTFAIISHPDAGKTTLTEKLLQFGGAIQMAGQVRARGKQRQTRSDWLEIERARGISVTSSVMTSDTKDFAFNLPIPPGTRTSSREPIA